MGTWSTRECVDRGKGAFTYFHNEASKFPDNYNLSFNATVTLINTRSRFFFEVLGQAILDAGLDESTVQARMVGMADANSGVLPNELNVFVRAMNPSAADAAGWTWGDGFKAVTAGVSDSIVQAGAVVEELGSAAKTGIVSTLSYLPLVIVGVVGVYFLVKKSAIA